MRKKLRTAREQRAAREADSGKSQGAAMGDSVGTAEQRWSSANSMGEQSAQGWANQDAHRAMARLSGAQGELKTDPSRSWDRGRARRATLEGAGLNSRTRLRADSGET